MCSRKQARLVVRELPCYHNCHVPVAIIKFVNVSVTLNIIYPAREFCSFWHDEIFNFGRQPHNPNLHIICILVFLFVSKESLDIPLGNDMTYLDTQFNLQKCD